MRIFIAFDIPADIRKRMSEYMERARTFAPDARWARVEGLHVTLKFVGEASDALVQQIKSAFTVIKATPFEVKFEGVGFFPNAKAARVFWIGVDGGDPLTQLAATIDGALDKLGIAQEEKAYHPHLTLARASSHPLRELQPLLNGPPPQFGTMAAQEFFLYQSQPQRGGSKYTRLERFRLE
ncbi:MAG TPA: RNA 2',3'-cyclic phosphodiesterase [Candidatus Angelobacter sp.]|nr:RNA 2',3'-cyclic phosphodiesterase [Candidatus Angelobacter sp.]